MARPSAEGKCCDCTANETIGGKIRGPEPTNRVDLPAESAVTFWSNDSCRDTKGPSPGTSGPVHLPTEEGELAEGNWSAKSVRSTPRTRIRTLEPVNASERTLRKTPSLAIVEQQILSLQRSSCFRRFKAKTESEGPSRLHRTLKKQPRYMRAVLVMATRWGGGSNCIPGRRQALARSCPSDDALLLRRRAPSGPALVMSALDSAAWRHEWRRMSWDALLGEAALPLAVLG
jgi:hypothetical protein